jgi:hypothetical protein
MVTAPVAIHLGFVATTNAQPLAIAAKRSNEIVQKMSS